MIPVEIKIIDPAVLSYGVPTTETAGAAGYDLRACIETPVTVLPDSVFKVPTGVAIHIKNRHYAGMIMPRSGLAAKFSITLQNAVGLLDSDYQGEVCILVRNEGREPYKINPGDRIAQLVFVPVVHPMLIVVQEFDTSKRGTGGFGSTGVVSRDLATASQYEPDSTSGRVLPSQYLGNDHALTPGEITIPNMMYMPTGQELLEAEYGED